MAKKEEAAVLPSEGTPQAPQAPVPAEVEPKGPEVVTIPRKEWEDAKAAIGKIGSMAETIEILTAAADKNRLAAIQDKLKTPGNSIVKIRTFRLEGQQRLVLGWHMTANDSYIDPLTKREVANQKIQILLEGDKVAELAYNDFSRFTEEKVLAEVVSRSGDNYTVRLLSDGRELVIDVKFLN